MNGLLTPAPAQRHRSRHPRRPPARLILPAWVQFTAVLLIVLQACTKYDAIGNAVATINPLGQEWHTVFDARNRAVQTLAPAVDGARAVTAYDSVGNVIARSDAYGHTTTMVYDAANRRISTVQPAVQKPDHSWAHPTTTQTYDANGNVLTVTDPNGHTVTNVYDTLNRLVTTTDALGLTVNNTYDPVGNKWSVTDGKWQTTWFTYDGLNRNVAVTDPLGHVTKTQYDALNKVQRTDALGQVTSYTYDSRNRLASVIYNGGGAANSRRNYAYDAHGNLLTVTEPDKPPANVAYTYDHLNRVVTETVYALSANNPIPVPVLHAYTYDAAGNRLTTVYGYTARTLTSTYDALNRLSTLTEGGRTTAYGYDLNGNITEKELPNHDFEVTCYDALNRARILSITQAGASITDYQYAYDLGGNVAKIIETYSSGLGSRTVTNTYDADNRLTQELSDYVAGTDVTTAYTYDDANNRTSQVITGGASAGTTTYHYNTLNQLLNYTDGTRLVTLTYDDNGNRATRTVSGGSDNGTDTYSYDFENRLIALVKGTAGGEGTYAYTYDYRTRRIVTSAGGVLTGILFSGGTSVQEFDLSHSGLTVEYIRGSDYGGGVGGILYTLRSGTPSYTHADKRGDIVAKTDGTGALTYQAQYQAFGQQVATSGSTLDRQKSNSKDTDPTGLVNEGMRYRDLETGMFISRDPAGFVDGPNLYTYVVQNPWTSFDPEGLQVPPGTNPYTDPGTGPGMSYEQFSSMSPGDQNAYMNGYRQGIRQAGPPMVVGTVATVATGGLAPEMFVAGALGRVAVSGFSGMVGGNAANMTSNAMNGQPLSTNGPQALVVGGVIGAGAQAIGEAIAANMNKVVASTPGGMSAAQNQAWSKVMANAPKDGSLTDVQARDWYNGTKADRGALIKQMQEGGASDEDVAKATWGMRNDARTKARALMSDREQAATYDKDNPNLTWDQTMKLYKGDYKKITEASLRSNPKVDKQAEDQRAAGGGG